MCSSIFTLALAATLPASGAPFTITVVDDQSGRGVPLIELTTVNHVQYVTDSAGVVAVDEPGLVGQTVFFHVKGHGYEHSKDGFGYRGKAFKIVEGGSGTIKVTRRNVAERLYRLTGEGIYRDTLRSGKTAPIRTPNLNAQVFGSDSVLNAVYGGKLWWFWGDTNRPGYPLGNFHVPGAWSTLPERGGLDPEVGVDLNYLVAPTGFAKETARLPGPGPTWLSGLTVLRGSDGRERMFAGYVKIKPPMETYEHGLVEWNPDTEVFDKIVTFPLDSAIKIGGHTTLIRDGQTDYVTFLTPYPLTRVKADVESLRDIRRYEAYTCLETGSRPPDPKGEGKGASAPRIDRGPDGRARYAWRADTPALGPSEQARLIREGHLKPDEALLALQDAETGKSVNAHGGTVFWNAYRQRWVLIAVEVFGSSLLGEVWFAEADTPLGPWVYARKVVTHDKYSFYNPRQHPYFDKEEGRVVFFEGTYTATFSGNDDPTPRYDYNQILYKLDLADPRLNLPSPVYDHPGEQGFATGAEHAGLGPARFFALERPGEGTVAVWQGRSDDGRRPALRSGKTTDGPPALFHGLPADATDPPKSTVALYECVSEDGRAWVYTTDPKTAPAGFKAAERPLCLVWKAPTFLVPPVSEPAR
ncbi:MAG: hypothetical protein AB7I30_04965 [Isosphaeraceae bacterium]